MTAQKNDTRLPQKTAQIDTGKLATQLATPQNQKPQVATQLMLNEGVTDPNPPGYQAATQ